MWNNHHFFIGTFLTLFSLGYIFIGCESVMESSHDPGILQITLQSNPSDTSIFIEPDTLSVSPNDSMSLKVFQGKAFNDSVYSILYKNLESTSQREAVYNIIKTENGEYKKYTIFETYVPPENYDRIQFGLSSNVLQLGDFDQIKVEAPQGTGLFVDVYQDFKINENRVTEVNLHISPFKSVKRYRDTYQFIPQVNVVNVKYH